MIDNSILDQMKEIWINLELYFKIYEFSNFRDFSGFFWIYFWISKDFPKLKSIFLIKYRFFRLI